MTYVIQRHATVTCPDLGDLEQLAEAEGYSFVTRTRSEWEAGVNRFDDFGECFFVAVIEREVLGICGLNRDPYVDDPTVGRLRHLYVHPSHRRAGMAAELVGYCLSAAVGCFESIRLRTSNPAADVLYRSIGFELVEDPSATHEWLPAR